MSTWMAAFPVRPVSRPLPATNASALVRTVPTAAFTWSSPGWPANATWMVATLWFGATEPGPNFTETTPGILSFWRDVARSDALVWSAWLSGAPSCRETTRAPVPPDCAGKYLLPTFCACTDSKELGRKTWLLPVVYVASEGARASTIPTPTNHDTIVYQGCAITVRAMAANIERPDAEFRS